jgi:hypothetical protein
MKMNTKVALIMSAAITVSITLAIAVENPAVNFAIAQSASETNNSTISLEDTITRVQKESTMVESARAHLQAAVDSLMNGDDAETLRQIELARMQMMILASEEPTPRVMELVNEMNSTASIAESMEVLDINETLSDINATILSTRNQTALVNLGAIPGEDLPSTLNATTIAERIEECLVLQNGTLACLQRSTVLR